VEPYNHQELMNSYRVALQGYSDAVSKMDELTGEELALARANAKAARLTCEQLRLLLEDGDSEA
jgi:hypothetical protein